jgi:hypothetical protein
MDDKTTGAPTKKEKPVFPGFNTSFKGFSQMPNEWLDEIISQIDNIAELKVVLYIYRHTWGFQEKKINPDDPAKHDEIKHITTDEFMHGRKKADGSRMDRGTGLSNRSVIDGLRNAAKHGYISEEINDTDKGRVAKSYALNLLKSTENSCEESSQGDVKNLHRGMKTTHSNCEETSHRSEKRTRAGHFEKNTKERKNDASEQSTNITTIEGSFSHPSSSLSSSLSGEGTKTELSPEVKHTYDLICQEMYPNCYPNLTTKAIEHFTKLAKDIKTVEDIKSLVAYCRQEQPILNTSKIHPGNLVRWLDGWLLQTQTPVTESLPELPGDPAVTDEELAEDVWGFVRAYRGEERFEECLNRVKAMKREGELSNYKMCDKMADACRRAPSSRYEIDEFFEQLRQNLYW